MKRGPSSFRNPATIALAAVLVGAVLGLQWLSRAVVEGYEAVNTMQMQTATVEGTGQISVEVVEVNELYALLSLGSLGTQTLGVLAAASALALVFVWCFRPRGERTDGTAPDAAQSSERTRTMSAAGSTVNLADTTVPNSSPSISNS